MPQRKTLNSLGTQRGSARWNWFLSLAAVGMLLASVGATFVSAADELDHGTETGPPSLLDAATRAENAAWFERLLVAQAESPSDRPALPIRPLPNPPEPGLVPPEGRPNRDPPPALTRPAPDGEDPEADVPAVPEPLLRQPASSRPESFDPPAGSTFTLFRRNRTRSSFARVRRPIAVLGDSLVDMGQFELEFTIRDEAGNPGPPRRATASTDIPVTALAIRRRISKNNTVLPSNRVILSYQHFQNAFSAEVSHPTAGVARQSIDLDRSTIGIEKTFFADRWSVDIRLPVLSRFDVAAPDFTLTNGRIGNVSLLLKHACYTTETTVWGAGCGIDFPTGSNGFVELPHSDVTIFNDAYHALPYVGFLHTPNDDTSIQGFVQLDIPLNGNEVQVETPSEGVVLDTFTEQELLFISMAMARRIYDNPQATCLQGIAALCELHYTTLMAGTDIVDIDTDNDSYDLESSELGVNYLNLALGMQADLGDREVRMGVVLPLLRGRNRPFDAEAIIQINHRF